ncbi:hypothetical protein HMI54_013874 [Coelomomyces lativittatus]|nr:hypothetical protein HMI55_005871 [Coelomomyces lativittatus]KAJ1497146.1 hypothetical protein HMI54_013874 [Coelomomyces lativittatus]
MDENNGVLLDTNIKQEQVDEAQNHEETGLRSALVGDNVKDGVDPEILEDTDSIYVPIEYEAGLR